MVFSSDPSISLQTKLLRVLRVEVKIELEFGLVKWTIENIEVKIEQEFGLMKWTIGEFK